MSADNARYSKLTRRIWSDREFVGLSSNAQRLYMLLLSQESRTNAGALPLTIRRWAAMAKDSTPESVVAALHELAAARFVVVDWNTDEVLIRTFIRNDELWKAPNMLKGALREAFLIVSPALRWVLYSELLKLPPHKERDNTLAKAELLVEGLERVAAEGFPEGFAEGFAEGMGNNLQPTTFTLHPSPSNGATARGRAGARERTPMDLTTIANGKPATKPPPPPPDRDLRADAKRLVEQVIPDTQPRTIRNQLTYEASRLLNDGLDEGWVSLGLKRWLGKRLPPSMLANMVADEMKDAEGTATGGTIDRSIDDIMARANRLADLASKENRNGPRELERHGPSPGQDQGV